jgi:uncharacterized protein involved in exopolysaccharide biosynthesis
MTKQSEQIIDKPCKYGKEEDGINLLDYWQVVWKFRKMIGLIVVITALTTFIFSLFMTNVYQAKAVIIPVTTRDSGGSGNGSLGALAQQFGGFAGISASNMSISSEIVSLLNSNILREKMILKYNLMPVLFYTRWDVKRQTWRPKSASSSINPLYYASLLIKILSPSPGKDAVRKDSNAPNTWDALRLLNRIVVVNKNTKENTITISVDFHDPELAAKILDYYLVTLTDYMSGEVKRVAATNRKYLEEQLGSTADPFIKQKTYNMIAQQIESGMMAEVKENFAFKVIDPPLAPDRKIKPKRVQIVLLSMFISLFLGICVAFFREYLHKIETINGEVSK